ncbi:hypothetical protein MINT15_00460 [Saccharomonospora viridis]|uniref:Uncharacterized protein n=1 Tax=Saccharomonospora viridis TaxID=1852 RepID=A0A837DEU8_9PSEU|nr:hypothetical protein MINT15_00460 [Saccharomonospora viridis]
MVRIDHLARWRNNFAALPHRFCWLYVGAVSWVSTLSPSRRPAVAV